MALPEGGEKDDVVNVGTVEVDLLVVVFGVVAGNKACFLIGILGHESGFDSMFDFGIELFY